MTGPTWLDYLYYERTLLAAILLVAVSLYAMAVVPVGTLSGPAASLCGLEEAGVEHPKFPWKMMLAALIVGVIMCVATLYGTLYYFHRKSDKMLEEFRANPPRHAVPPPPAVRPLVPDEPATPAPPTE